MSCDQKESLQSNNTFNEYDRCISFKVNKAIAKTKYLAHYVKVRGTVHRKKPLSPWVPRLSSPPGLLFLVVYFGLLALLLSPVTPTSVSTSLQASTMPAVIVGRVGHTSFNTFIISLIYTTVQMFGVTQTIWCFTSKLTLLFINWIAEWI